MDSKIVRKLMNCMHRMRQGWQNESGKLILDEQKHKSECT